MTSGISIPTLPAARRVPKKPAVQPTIVVADDHPIVGTLLSRFLGAAGGYTLVGTATDGESALALCRMHRPELLILDLVMPRMSGIEVLRVLKAEGVPTKSVVFTSMETPDALREAMINGACGYLAKTTPFSEVMTSLEKVLAGEFAFTGQTSDLLRQWVVGGEQAAMLSDVETTVLRRVALGQSAKEICGAIALSESGTYRLIERIKQKLKAETLQELTLMAVRRGLVPL